MHGSYKTEAVVLRSLRLGEADRVLHLYTPARGRVGAVAKGVRRTRSRVGARLEPFSHVALVLHEGRGELHTVSGVDTSRPITTSASSPGARASRARAARRCCKMFAEGDPSPRVFAALCRLLDVLDDYEPAPGDAALDPLLLAFQLSSTGSPASPRGSRHAPRARRRTCRSCASRPPPAAPSAAAARALSRCRPAPSRRSAALLRAPLAELPALTPRVAATVARCASDLNAEHGGFRLRSLALTARG